MGSGSTQTQDAEISEEDAKRIALEDAGFSEEELSGIRVKLDMDDGVQIYEVEFYVGTEEYDYEIDATSGEIRSKDMDIEEDFREGDTASSVISEEEAQETALAKVPGATAENLQMKLEYDDGRQVYEGSIIYNGKEYEFEIDASSGKILSWEEEH